MGSKLYWYGSGGEILAETNTSGNTTAEYIFFGGKRIAMLPAGGNPVYYVEDMLGTSRVLTTNTGVVCYDADFYPYGGERTPYTNNCPATNNYKFEGKERDIETLNDDFGARYYSNRFGRWLSADWSSVPVPVPYANLTNPQTLNLYAMVADDPESFADLDGHFDNLRTGNDPSGLGGCMGDIEHPPMFCGQGVQNDQRNDDKNDHKKDDPPPAQQPAQNQSQDQAQQQSQTQQQAAVTAPFPLISSTAGTGVAATVSAGAIVVGAAALLIHNVTETLIENARGKEQLAAIESVVAVENARLLAMASEHTKGKRESTRTKHEEGEARKGRDRGGEKGDAGNFPRKPPRGWKERKFGNKSGRWPPTSPRDVGIAGGLLGQ